MHFEEYQSRQVYQKEVHMFPILSKKENRQYSVGSHLQSTCLEVIS